MNAVITEYIIVNWTVQRVNGIDIFDTLCYIIRVSYKNKNVTIYINENPRGDQLTVSIIWQNHIALYALKAVRAVSHKLWAISATIVFL